MVGPIPSEPARRFAFLAALLSAIIAALVLVGWALDVASLRTVLPGYISMKANTAVAILALAGATLSVGRARGVAIALAVLAAAVGLATLGEYVWGVDLGIDELLVVDADAVGKSYPPGRLAPVTAVALASLGLGFALVHATARWHRLGQLLAAITALVSSQALVSYMMDVQSLFGLAAHTRIALHTALALVLLSGAVLVSFGPHGYMRVLLSGGAAGRTARTLIFAVMIGPPGFHVLQALGQRAGLYDADFGTLIRVMGSVVFFIAMVWRCSEDLFASELALEVHETARARVEAQAIAAAMIERSEAKLRSIIDSAHDAIIGLTAEGSITDWNPRAEAIFGWTQAEARGRAIDALILGDGGAPILDANARTSRTFELIAKRNDGRSIDILLAVTPIEVGSERSFTVFAADIGERRRNEQAQDESRQRAVDAARIKAEFLANMSHEIRTPLNGIIGMTDLLAETELGPLQQKYVRIVQSSGNHLLTIVNDLLDFSKIEAGKLHFETIEFSIATVLRSQIELLMPKVKDKTLAITTQLGPGVPAMLKGDPGRLGQVLLNLLGNAIKFTAKGSIHVRVELASVSEERAEIRFSVSDTGVGLTPEARGRLFQPFTQADGSTARQFGGTGLGLSISKRLVELMDGQIGVESTFGEGSTFWFTCSLGRTESSQVALERGPKPASRSIVKARILVAEDNPVNQLLVLTMLRKLGYTAQAVGNGREAVSAIASSEFDLVLMDCQMPEMDGFQATRSIREAESRDGRTRLPVIALTANAMAQDIQACLEVGMDDHVAKPIRKSSLDDAIQQALARRADLASHASA